jgi:short-subunit dehydrogenase
MAKPLALITGASSGIGYQLARCCAQDGYDLVIVADEKEINEAAKELETLGAKVEPVEADLAKVDEVDKLLNKIGSRQIDVLVANAGRGLGKGFLDQDWKQIRRVIDTNVTGTVYLIQKIAQKMRNLNKGKILITGSIAGFMPGSFQAVYNGTKAFIDSFSFALRNELQDTKITVTCLMPGATDTKFFERAEMMDSRVGKQKKDSPILVAKAGYDAMQRGDGDIVSGWKNKIQSAMANIMPASVLAQQHRKMAEPGSARK